MKHALALLPGVLLLLAGTVCADALPEGAVRRLGTTSFRLGTGEDDPVLACSPDGKVLAVSKGRGDAVYLLDAQTGAGLRRLIKPWHCADQALGFSPDGRILVARYGERSHGDGKAWLHFWDLSPARAAQPSIRVPDAAPVSINKEDYWKGLVRPFDTPIPTWGFSPDSQFLATTDGHTVRLVKTEGWRDVGTVYSTRVVTAVAVFPGGKRVAVGREDGTVRIYDVASGIGRRDLGARGDAGVSDLALSPDGTLLAAALGGDRAVPLWKLGDDHDRPIALEANDACEVVFARDGKSLTVTSADGSHRIFSASGKVLRKVDFDKPTPTALTPDGQTLAWIENRVVHRLDTATGKDRPLAPGHSGTVRLLTFARDGKSLIARHDSTELTWDVRSGKLLAARATEEPYPDPSLVPDVRLHNIEGDVLPRERRRKGSTSRPSRKEYIQALQKSQSGAGVFSPDGRLVATLARHQIDPWLEDVVTERILGELPLAAMLTEDEAIELRTSKTLPLPVLAFSPDCRRLAVALPTGSIHVFDLLSRQCLWHFRGHSGWTVTSLAFSPDGRLLASGSDDTSILLWDLGPREKRGDLDAARLRTLWSARFRRCPPGAGGGRHPPRSADNVDPLPARPDVDGGAGGSDSPPHRTAERRCIRRPAEGGDGAE